MLLTLCIGTTPWCVTSIIWHCTAPDAAYPIPKTKITKTVFITTLQDSMILAKMVRVRVRVWLPLQCVRDWAGVDCWSNSESRSCRQNTHCPLCRYSSPFPPTEKEKVEIEEENERELKKWEENWIELEKDMR